MIKITGDKESVLNILKGLLEELEGIEGKECDCDKKPDVRFHGGKVPEECSTVIDKALREFFSKDEEEESEFCIHINGKVGVEQLKEAIEIVNQKSNDMMNGDDSDGDSGDDKPEEERHDLAREALMRGILDCANRMNAGELFDVLSFMDAIIE